MLIMYDLWIFWIFFYKIFEAISPLIIIVVHDTLSFCFWEAEILRWFAQQFISRWHVSFVKTSLAVGREKERNAQQDSHFNLSKLKPHTNEFLIYKHGYIITVLDFTQEIQNTVWNIFNTCFELPMYC